MSEPLRVVRHQTYAATWKSSLGTAVWENEVLSSPPIFKPGHVLFPLADGSYRAEHNDQVRSLRWTTIPQVIPQPEELLLPKH